MRHTTGTRRVKLLRNCFGLFLLIVVNYHSAVASGFKLQPISIQRSQLSHSSRKRAVAKNMVLRIPEFIIEQESTDLLVDMIIDESVQTRSRRPVVLQFEPSRGWIWQRWKGTVFSETWKDCIRNMMIAILLLGVFYCNSFNYRLLIQQHLNGLYILWGQLFSVTTFTLTFFVNQSYALWRKCYGLSCGIQRRFHDISMLLAVHAARETQPASNTPSGLFGSRTTSTTTTTTTTTYYTPEARQLLVLISRYVRLFQLLMYGSLTRSHRPILTRRGMTRLVERGLLTKDEKDILMRTATAVPATQRHCCVLMWIIRAFIEGRMAGHFLGGPGLEQEILDLCHLILAQAGAIGGSLQGRMPHAYAHLVQVLVDCVLYMYPIMAVTSGISPVLGVLGIGLLTIFYQGLLDLAKQFLDPYDNEIYGRGEDTLCVATLIADSNAASIRWILGLAEMPVSVVDNGAQDDGWELKVGDHQQLPVHGYSVAEVQQMKNKRRQQHRQQHQQMEKELLYARSEVGGRVNQEDGQGKKKEKWAKFQQVQEEEENNSIYKGNPISMVVNNHKFLDVPNSLIPLECDNEGVNKAEALNSQGGNNSSNNKVADVHKVVFGGEEKLHVALEAINKEQQSQEDGLPFSVFITDDEKEINAHDSKVGEHKNGQSLVEHVYHEKQGEHNSTKHNKHQRMEAQWEIFQGVDEEEVHYYLEQTSTELISNLPWHDEIGPDGKEYRLSQMLADEVWEEEEETQGQENYVEDYSAAKNIQEDGLPRNPNG